LLRIYVRKAARLRESAANATTIPLKARLLDEAEQQERLAEELKKDGAWPTVPAPEPASRL
jgi:hypothetical protein